MKYRFSASRAFWRNFSKLSIEQQQGARTTFRIFKENPFDSRLRSHKIHKLSAATGARSIRLRLNRIYALFSTSKAIKS
jgi:hypothetical protein